MYTYHFFLGLIVSPDLKICIDGLDPAVKSLFLDDQDLYYLQLVTHEETNYIGKYILPPMDLSTLQELKTHILSLIQHLSPQLTHSLQNFFIITLPLNESRAD